MDQAESSSDSPRVFTREKWFVQLGSAARGIACCSKCGTSGRIVMQAAAERRLGTRRRAGDPATEPSQPSITKKTCDKGSGNAWNCPNPLVCAGRPETSREEIMKKSNSGKIVELRQRRDAPLATPTDLTRSATRDIAAAMNTILADVFALYLKTKNFHWHMSGPHFRDYHLLLDEQAEQLFAMTDPIAERIRKIGGLTIRSIGHISRTQRVLDNDAEYVEPLDMIAELADDNKTLAARLREAHNVCDEHRDVATASLIEVWIDEAERRTWFLSEIKRGRQ